MSGDDLLKGVCSGCGGGRDREGQRYCRKCNAEANRKFRERRKRLFEEMLRRDVPRETNGADAFHDKQAIGVAA